MVYPSRSASCLIGANEMNGFGLVIRTILINLSIDINPPTKVALGSWIQGLSDKSYLSELCMSGYQSTWVSELLWQVCTNTSNTARTWLELGYHTLPVVWDFPKK